MTPLSKKQIEARKILNEDPHQRDGAYVDTDLVMSLAQIGCTETEIADIVGCHYDTLRANHKDIIRIGHATMKESLRRQQLRACEGGSVPMLIHLGKTLLNQKEVTKIETEETTVSRLVVEFVDVPKQDDE